MLDSILALYAKPLEERQVGARGMHLWWNVGGNYYGCQRGGARRKNPADVSQIIRPLHNLHHS